MKVIQTVMLEDKERKMISDFLTWLDNLNEVEWEALEDSIGSSALFDMRNAIQSILDL